MHWSIRCGQLEPKAMPLSAEPTHVYACNGQTHKALGTSTRQHEQAASQPALGQRGGPEVRRPRSEIRRQREYGEVIEPEMITNSLKYILQNRSPTFVLFNLSNLVPAFNSGSVTVLDFGPVHTLDSNADLMLGFEFALAVNFGLVLALDFTPRPVSVHGSNLCEAMTNASIKIKCKIYYSGMV
ncbi:hypothetical protein EVAR_90169_1 [Eumeta japonica]|uniref:Uncharacterized protein n=1 Tax=Eumeta variegata TaxID=151549 RepID=A0A4C1WUP5_EUMVA|nr:hypothetical protein EVAR_90169_1 [Eumeta japonica]